MIATTHLVTVRIRVNEIRNVIGIDEVRLRR